MAEVRAFLELVRPANVTTALADVLAGVAVGSPPNLSTLPWLLPATACLYAGGIALNDVFDRETDAAERPERPIPSGRVSVLEATALGGSLVAAGVLAASMTTPAAAEIALATAGAVLVYDAAAKRHSVLGPVNMGACRGLNLALGIAASPAALATHWPLAFIPASYICAVTAVSRGEVKGSSRNVALLAVIVCVCVLAALMTLALLGPGSRLAGIALTGVLAWRVVPAFAATWRNPAPEVARNAVRIGVLSLVLVDAVIAASYAGMIYSLSVLAAAAGASWLARRFAVT